MVYLEHTTKGRVEKMEKGIVGKKIMAQDGARRRNIGVIQSLDNERVQIFCESNPRGYQDYEISILDFVKWIDEKLYTLRKN